MPVLPKLPGGERPLPMRRSCNQAELAQAQGLPNHGSMVPLSIFNGDEDFAFLAAPEELLPRTLCDWCIRHGKNSAESCPICERVAQELPGSEV
ncbi:MAG: DUF2927 domain-containing protein [Boseongicola sp. SB0676_bin_33]|uniref:DUF2927 domain-containing protein n=1 Tax=Boseongicola sp. SB0664_bin_43 TaxID=2604844 RepID=A0A6B0Y455_9RHOB|nr:DUF2927 domain-containing protein [Boseongicola sp. SB0664_bin_43]MYF88665.1 DUF2927 domain-containing protein [Boseongicola sp. SB0676_bin_33]